MNNILFTFCIAFALVVLCLIFLGIGKIVTGKSRLKLGMCGRDPHKKQKPEEGCGTDRTCGFCSRSDEEKDE